MKHWRIYIYIYIFKVNNWGKENLLKKYFCKYIILPICKRLSFYHASKSQVYLMILYLYSQLTPEYTISYYLPCVILLKKKELPCLITNP